MSPELWEIGRDIWEMLQAAGTVLCVAFYFLWRMSNDERREYLKTNGVLLERILDLSEKHRAEKDAITERAVEAINSARMVIQGLVDLMKMGKGHS